MGCVPLHLARFRTRSDAMGTHIYWFASHASDSPLSTSVRLISSLNPHVKMAPGIERSSTTRQSRSCPRTKATSAALLTSGPNRPAKIAKRRASCRVHGAEEAATNETTPNNESADQVCSQPKRVTIATPMQRPIFDLTVGTEHCSICSNVLGVGNVYTQRMFVFEDCGCASFTVPSWSVLTKFQVMCGECSLAAFPDDQRTRSDLDIKVWCPRFNHFAKGEQAALEIFGVECAICMITTAERFDEPHTSTHPQSCPDRIFTPCGKLGTPLLALSLLTGTGHVFCHNCINEALEKSKGRTCPTCKARLPERLQNCRTVPCGDAYEETGLNGGGFIPP